MWFRETKIASRPQERHPRLEGKTRRSLSSPMRLETALLDIPPCAVLFLQVIGDNQRLFDGRAGSQIPGEIEPLAQFWRD
jgi:hypothetical protein